MWINVLCQPGEALNEAMKLAQRVAANAPLAVRETLATMKATALVDEKTAFQQSRDAITRLSKTEDFQEGPRAFIEKRAPEWKGK